MHASLKATIVVALLLCARASQAGDSGVRAWLRDRTVLELIGQGGFRVSLGAGPHASGFDAALGGGDFLLGINVYGGLSVFTTGRVQGGERNGDSYFEGLGGVGLQAALNARSRLRVAVVSGQALHKDEHTTLVGGFLAASIDLLPIYGERLASAISLRFDLDGAIAPSNNIPDLSMGLSLGLGIRY